MGGCNRRSTAKTNAIELPLVILINRDTYGAAEALAAALRQAEGALIIGSPSAGRAYFFKDVRLSMVKPCASPAGTISAGNGDQMPRRDGPGHSHRGQSGG